jgi:hypothetical protein
MALTALQTPRYLRQTQLGPNQYQKNFCQLDHDILDALASPAAAAVTPSMCRIYLRLRRAPHHYWERTGVLHLRGEERAGQWVSAWRQLCELVGVASATANKALRWLHEQGIIGYFAGKNGVGIRIFFNRAANSIGQRPGTATPPVRAARPGAPPAPRVPSGGQKILPFPRASTPETPASAVEAPFKDEGLEKSLDAEIDSPAASRSREAAPAPSGGTHITSENLPPQPPVAAVVVEFPAAKDAFAVPPANDPHTAQTLLETMAQMLAQTRRELAFRLEQQLQQAVGQATQREAARTRQWFEERALPKAVRVAQRETYQLLRRHDGLREQERAARAALQVGRQGQGREACVPAKTVPDKAASAALTAAQITDYAEICATQWALHRQPVSVTLQCFGEDGSGLTAGAARRVQAEATRLIAARGV